MNFPNYWSHSVVVSVMSENVLPLEIYLELPITLITSSAIAVCIFSGPAGNSTVHTFTLILSQYIVLLALMLQPESAAHALINHSHWSDILGNLKNYARAKLTLTR